MFPFKLTCIIPVDQAEALYVKIRIIEKYIALCITQELASQTLLVSIQSFVMATQALFASFMTLFLNKKRISKNILS